MSGQYPAAAKQHKEVLRLATEHDNRGQIRSLLAENYEDMGQPSKALWHYKRTLRDNLHDDDLRDEDVEAIKKRVAALEQAEAESTQQTHLPEAELEERQGIMVGGNV